MKITTPFIILGMIGGLTACGSDGWEKEPTRNVTVYNPSTNSQTDLETLAKQQYEKEKADTAAGNRGPRVITKTVVVEKPAIVVREETTVDAKFLVISPDAKMTFNEGAAGVFKVRARALAPDTTLKLSATGLPEGAVLEKSATEKDLYLIKWTPKLYTLASDSTMAIFDVKLTAQIVESKDAQFKGLTSQKDVQLLLFRTQEAPKSLKVENLPNEIQEGQVIPFAVTVVVPGIDQHAAVKPRLVVSYDGVSLSAGNSFLELDGSRYVVADLNKKDAEYLGDSKWRFALTYDTKNISVQPQLGKDGKLLEQADGTRVRLSFKVYSPFGLATPETLTQLKIRHTAPVQAAAPAPATPEVKP